MGTKHASIHLRCDDSNEVLVKLKRVFSKKKGPSKTDMMHIELIKAVANMNINKITDPTEKAEKEALLSEGIERALNNMGAGDPAVIVVRKHFVSIYWYDHIRNENIEEEIAKYVQLCRVPALGVSLYDGTNFLIYALCKAENSNAQWYSGEYFFDSDDITPVKAEDICDTIDAPFFLEGMQKVLSKDNGEDMAAAFEQETKLPILMFDEDCRENDMKTLHRWGRATVYCEKYE